MINSDRNEKEIIQKQQCEDQHFINEMERKKNSVKIITLRRVMKNGLC